MPTWLQHLLEYVAGGVAFAVAYHSLNDNPHDYIGFRTRPHWQRLSFFSPRRLLRQALARPILRPTARRRVRRRF
jgi:hypothetical protein